MPPRSTSDQPKGRLKFKAVPGGRSSPRTRRSIFKTAFNWTAYKSRSNSLRLLRQNQIHVDATLRTQDGYSEPLHWQVIVALCPELIECSNVSRARLLGRRSLWHYRIELPERVSGQLARLLVECAYGEEMLSLDKSNLLEFYLLCNAYNIEHGVACCLDYVCRWLEPDNCVQMLSLAIRHRHRKLRRAAYAVIRSSFKLVLSINRDFHCLPAGHLKRLLEDDFLKLNEDEELAWLAIVRWMRRPPMARLELAHLFGQMIADEVTMSMIQVQQQQHQQQPNNVLEPIRQLMRRSTNESNLSRAVKISINFNASPVQLFNQADRPRRRSSSQSSPSNLLRAVANEIGEVVSLGNQSELATNGDQTDQLFDLVKRLRFMRFKSAQAFNVILGDPLISQSERLTLLVSHMKLRYMIRNGIPLSDDDLNLVSEERLARLRREESRTSRRKQIVELVSSLVKCQPPAGGQTMERTRTEELQKATRRLTEGTLRQQLGAKSLTRANTPRVPTSVGLLIGGWQDGAVCKSIMAYDFVCDRWFKLNLRLPEPRAYHASCSSPQTGQIYIFGGTNGREILRSALRINLATCCAQLAHHRQVAGAGGPGKLLARKFRPIAPMGEPRCHLSGVFHSDGRLYALGGHNGSQRLRSAESYEPRSNQWRPIAQMTISRSDASACSHQGRIFIAGGQISDQFIQSSVEFYKSSDDTWTFASPMIIPRMSFCLASYKGQLMAIGGTNGLMGGDDVASVTRSVERYCPELASWSFCAPMQDKRCSFGVMRIENKLIVVGGHGGRRRLRSCESLRIGQITQSSSDPSSLQLLFNRSLRLAGGKSLARPRSAGAVGLAAEAEAAASEIRSPSFPGRLDGPAPRPGLVRSAMKWVGRARLPERRSGFSICVVDNLRTARDFTYFGSLNQLVGGKRTALIKRRSRWHKFKLIKRRKLLKHLKIGLVLAIVVLLL